MTRPNAELVVAEENFADQEWRLDNLYNVTTDDKRVVGFQRNPVQRHFYANRWYRNSILKSRKHGFTTFIAILGLDTCLFQPNTEAGFIAHGLSEATKIFNKKILWVYQQLPAPIRERVPLVSETKSSLEFANGSTIHVGTSTRSGTPNFLHVSEFGKIAAQRPDKAVEVVTGAFESVPKDGLIFVESTAEGMDGEFYRLDKAARDSAKAGESLSTLDFKAHFYAWWQDPRNTLPEDAATFNAQEEEYFFTLRAQHGIEISLAQKCWYVKKERLQREHMKREHPSTPEEAFEASIEGAYFSREMTLMREQKRICEVPYDPNLPTFTFWDLGRDDYMAIWVAQRSGLQNRLINYYENHLEGPDHYAEVLKKMNYRFLEHYMPHDVENQTWAMNKNGILVWRDAGVFPVRKVPRALDQGEVHAGIQACRNFLDMAVIDAKNCAVGIKHLDNFRKEWDQNLSTFKNKPRSDQHKHGCDALRTGAVGLHAPIGQAGTRRGKVTGATGLMGRTHR